MADVSVNEMGEVLVRELDRKPIDLSDVFLSLNSLFDREGIDQDMILTYDKIKAGPVDIVASKDGKDVKVYWDGDIQYLGRNISALRVLVYEIIKGIMPESRKAA